MTITVPRRAASHAFVELEDDQPMGTHLTTTHVDADASQTVDMAAPRRATSSTQASSAPLAESKAHVAIADRSCSEPIAAKLLKRRAAAKPEEKVSPLSRTYIQSVCIYIRIRTRAPVRV